jgi:hypothetical protein
MFTPAPIGKDFIPYDRRPMLRHNTGLFVGVSGRGSGISRVVPQQLDQCTGKANCTPCGFGGTCYNGHCVYYNPACP